MNYLEQLISEWYQYQGYFVRQNVRIEKRATGGYNGEMDIVAFHPEKRKLLHIEASSDTLSWKDRETRFKKKFELGKKHVHKLFKGLDLPEDIEQQVVFLFSSKTTESIGGAKVIYIHEFLKEIHDELKNKSIRNEIVPENFALLRTVHIVLDQYKKIVG